MLSLPALVLTAGLGTRLRPLSDIRAKPAMPVAGEALVCRILRWLCAEGVTEAVLNLHHLPETITAAVGDGAALGLTVRYSWEPLVLGSAGGPRRALPLLGADRFLVVNGDTLTDLDLDPLVAEHDRSGALVTMVVIPNPAPERYGGVLVNESGEVTGFVRRGTPGPSWHFVGVQTVCASAFAGLSPGEPRESVSWLYPALMRERPGSVRAFRADGAFFDIGTPSDYLATSLTFARAEGGERRLVGSGCAVAPTARLTRTVLWDHVTVGDDAGLTDCVVADGVHVPSGARFQGCAIVPARGRSPRRGQEIHGELLVAPIAATGRPQED